MSGKMHFSTLGFYFSKVPFEGHDEYVGYVCGGGGKEK